MKLTGKITVCFLLVAGALAVPGSAPVANELGNKVVVPDTDFVAAGVGGMRGTGTGQITVAGVSGTVTKALLYWNGPTNSEAATANAAVTFEGNEITGTNIGFSHDNCWNFDNSQSYRADVTSIVVGKEDANDTYDLSNFRKTSGDIEFPTTVADVNGASLIVFFDDGDDANDRDVTIVDGNDSNFASDFDAEGWDATIADIAYSSGAAHLQLHVSDGQSYTDGAVFINEEELLPTGGNFQGNTVPGTFGGNPEGVTGNLWDITNHTITEFMTSPATTLNLTSPLATDCLSLVVAVVDVPSPAEADLSIEKADEPDPVTAGGALLYTLMVANGGPDDATNVVVVDALPSGTTFVSAEGDGWTCGEDDGEVVCTRPSLPANSAAPDIEIVVETTTAGTITNVADVSADEGDPVAANNHVEEETMVQSQSTPDSATAFCPDGCTLTTDTGAGATPDDNTVSTLIVPDDADPQTVSITEVAATTDPDFCGGQTCSGQLVGITDITGVANPNEPIILQITYDKTVKGGSQIYILKPGFTSPRLVANCTTPGIASPNPCVSSKTVLANGDRMFTILLLSGDPILGKK